MIPYEELVEMIRAASTEQLPIAVLTIKEMRQFAEKVALDILTVLDDIETSKRDAAEYIKGRYITN